MEKRGRKAKRNEKFLIKSKLDFYFNEEKEKTGKSLEEIYEEVADYLGVGVTIITKAKLGLNNLSLVNALKLAEYFNANPNKMWEIIENPDFIDKEKCIDENCKRKSFAKGYCRNHYYQFMR